MDPLLSGVDGELDHSQPPDVPSNRSRRSRSMGHLSFPCLEKGNTMRVELQYVSGATKEYTIQLLKHITNQFSEESIIGRGGSGVVYKGVLENGEEIAMKKLYQIPGLDDTQFTNEFNSLTDAKHKNIIRLLGYCYYLGHECVEHEGKYVFADVRERLLCYEYLQGGNLDKYISDESCGLDWHTRYKIIKGVCDGLYFLHTGFKDPICHLDLKPANILLDRNMIPKIADFGLSRLFVSAEPHITKHITGTIGYMPPEFIERGKISPKFDIFSLGVIIIKIIAGPDGYSRFADMSPEEFNKQLHENWAKRLAAAHTSEDIKTCMDIASRCVERDEEKRPCISKIINELNKIDADFVDVKVSSRSLMDSFVSPRCVWVNGPVIVGAGPSGLAVAASLREKGVPFVVLEREDCIASMWQKRTYDSLKLNTPKQLCELPRMPFPYHYPEYITRDQFIEYLEDYAACFDIKPEYNRAVLSARYDQVSGLWRVRVAEMDGPGLEFISRWLIVATGANTEKNVPQTTGLTCPTSASACSWWDAAYPAWRCPPTCATAAGCHSWRSGMCSASLHYISPCCSCGGSRSCLWRRSWPYWPGSYLPSSPGLASGHRPSICYTSTRPPGS